MDRPFLMDRVIPLRVSLPSTVIRVHTLRLFWTDEPLHGDYKEEMSKRFKSLKEVYDRGLAATQRDGN